MNVDKPDKKLITLYLTCLYQHLAESEQEVKEDAMKPVVEDSLTIKVRYRGYLMESVHVMDFRTSTKNSVQGAFCAVIYLFYTFWDFIGFIYLPLNCT